jgi:voltage-gated potassium channel
MVPQDTESSLSRREEWLARLERWTEWPLTALALLLIPILLAPYLFPISPSTRSMLDDLDYLIWGVFAADLTIKLLVAPHRTMYLRKHWFDVILVALPMLRPLRATRSLGELRSLVAVRAVAASGRVMVVSRQLLTRHGFQYVLLSAIIVVLAAGSLVTVFEREAPDANIKTLPDGLWWAVATITTVG